MSSHRIHKRRALSALIAAIALAGASVFLTAAPASAHDELVSSDPAAGATLDALPAQLTLTFSGVLSTEQGATELQVTDAAGIALTGESSPVVADTTVTQALAGGERSGVITVLWKVVSSDGHPISGEYTFTVNPPAPAPSATPTEEPIATASATPVATETAVPVTDDDSDSDDVWPWVVGAILLVAVAGAVTYLLVSRARRNRGY